MILNHADIKTGIANPIQDNKLNSVKIVYDTAIGSNTINHNSSIDYNKFPSNKYFNNYTFGENSLKITHLDDNLTHENIIICVLDKSNQSYKDDDKLSYQKNKNDKKYQIYDYAYCDLDSSEIFYGVSSKQNYEINDVGILKLKKLKNEYREIQIFNSLDDHMQTDAITNIKLTSIMKQYNIFNSENVECVLKINGMIICSYVFNSECEISFLDFPNIILHPISHNQNISIFLRFHTNTYHSIKNNYAFYVSYDAIYFNHNSRIKLSKINKYKFKTTSDIWVIYTQKQFCVRYFSDLCNSIHNNFKFLYDDKNTIDNTKNIDDIHITI